MGSNSGVWVTHCPEVPRDPALGCWANPASSDAGLLLQEDPPPTRGDGRAAPGLLRAGRAAARFTYSPQVRPAALGSQPPGTSLGWSHQAESGAQGPQETSGDLSTQCLVWDGRRPVLVSLFHRWGPHPSDPDRQGGGRT